MNPTQESLPSPIPRVVLIAGGSGGVGSEVAARLRRDNVTVILAARDSRRLAECAAALGAEAVPLDATRSADVEACAQDIVRRHGRLDGVVNCVGSILLKPAHLTSDDDWNATLATNLTTSFNLLRAGVRVMMTGGGGSIVLISTVAAQRGLFNHEAIAAAKAGVEGLTRSAASTYARYKIRVNCVAPGLVRTPLSRAITGSEAALKASLALHPLGRVGEPGDIASAICWLLSPEQSWITGQVLHVDGGLSTVQPR
jgi:NAD(P)-dependent dehydrogenase (short-subunit alcohol dehydrogenase family)